MSFPFRSVSRILLLYAFLCCTLWSPPSHAAESSPQALAILEHAIDYWRGTSSIATFSLTIHRPDFERTMSMKGWTKGRQNGLFFVLSPPKDAGNGTLKKGREMWTYNPKINRVIKLPPSMMSQSWMGSDFSNDDLAKSDNVLDEYIHRITGEEVIDGLTHYTIEAMAKEEAPVVWGKQELLVREDDILLRQSFYDEDMILVKEMIASDITSLDDRLFPRHWEMRRVDKDDQYTRLKYQDIVFDVDIKDTTFSLMSLKQKGR